MNKSVQTYMNQRELLLQSILQELSTDERFVAAWLTGSFARGEQDALSDIDITLVVADGYAPALCARPRMVSAQTTKERYELFSLFGRPALLHENNHNAPEGGTFTFVAYEQNAIMVDWILVPATGAQRPASSRLLFDKANIPIQPPAEPEDQEQRANEAAEIMAFFWMMTAVTVKYIYRGDGVFVNTWLDALNNMISEVERRIKGQAWRYKRGSHTELTTSHDEQIIAIRQLCGRMENLKHDVERLGGYVPESPMTTVEVLIGIAQEKTSLEKKE